MATLTGGKQDIYGTLSVNRTPKTEAKGYWERLYPSGFLPELKELVKLVIPMVLTQLCQYMIGPVALMFCGHLGKIELAAVALANSFINISGITIALGLACACDTLFGQVYGSSNRHRMGVELQRSLLILVLAVFPCWAIHLNMEAILRLLGQDPQVARKSAEYLLVFMPGILFFFIYVPLSKYIQNQNIVVPNLVIGTIANGINALLHYLLVIVADLGINGSALAQVISYFMMMLLTLLFILKFNNTKETWQGWSVDCLCDWGQFLRLGAFGLIMLCVEYWSFEIGIITAGLLSTSYLGAMSVIFQLETFAYMIPLGSGIAASIRVAQFLGAGDAKGAQTSARVTMTAVCGVEIVVALMFITLRNYLPLLFTNVPEVIELVRNVLYVCAVYQISDGLGGVGAGILRGQGRQNLGAAIVVGGFASALCVGTPLMLYTPLRLYAFWGGLAIALTIEGILFTIIINTNDWEKQAHEAQIRTRVISQPEMLDESDEDQERLPLTQSKSTEHLVTSTKEDQDSNDNNLLGGRPLSRSIIIHRLLALALMLCIFIGGILLRLFYTNHLQIPATLPVEDNVTTFTWSPTDSEGYSTSDGVELYTAASNYT